MAREAAGFRSASALARLMRIDPDTQLKRESGKLEIGGFDAGRYAQALNITTDWLLRGRSDSMRRDVQSRLEGYGSAG